MFDAPRGLAERVADAREVADRIHRELAAPMIIDDEPQVIAASIGIVEATERHRTPDDLLRDADAAMYAAKAAGKERHETYVPGIEDAANVTLSGVVPAEAIAWADYMQRLRHEIADRRLSGHIPSQTRAPEDVHRTLERVLAAISRLPLTPRAPRWSYPC